MAHILALAGGVGGAKLAHGLYRALPPHNLAVIVNTADDLRWWPLDSLPGDTDTVPAMVTAARRRLH